MNRLQMQGTINRRTLRSLGRIVYRFAALLLLLVGCANATPQSQTLLPVALPNGLPQSAHEAAVNRILEAGKPGFQDGPCGNSGAIECRDFQVKCARKLAASEAASAGGDAKWCILEAYQRRFKPDGEWTSSVRPIELVQRGSAWDASLALCTCQ